MKNYKYEIVANDTFTILDSKQQSIRPEEKKNPLLSISASKKDEIKQANASDENPIIITETKVDKKSEKTETKVVTGVLNFTSMYYLMMISSVAMVIYILIKKRSVNS